MEEKIAEDFEDTFYGIEIRKVDNGYIIHVSKTEPEETYVAIDSSVALGIVGQILDRFEKKKTN